MLGPEPDYNWYGGADISLEKDITVDITMDKETDPKTAMVISMGQIIDSDKNEVPTPASTITLSDFSLTKIE